MRKILLMFMLSGWLVGPPAALGAGEGMADAARVPVPEAVLRAIMEGDPPEEQRKLLRNDTAFKGYSIDLNEDGQAELIVVASNSYYCGSGGCGTWIFQQQGGRYQQLLNAFGQPYISRSRTQGYFDFVAISNSGAYREIGEVYRWQGSAYESKECFMTDISATGERRSHPCPP